MNAYGQDSRPSFTLTLQLLKEERAGGGEGEREAFGERSRSDRERVGLIRSRSTRPRQPPQLQPPRMFVVSYAPTRRGEDVSAREPVEINMVGRSVFISCQVGIIEGCQVKSRGRGWGGGWWRGRGKKKDVENGSTRQNAEIHKHMITKWENQLIQHHFGVQQIPSQCMPQWETTVSCYPKNHERVLHCVTLPVLWKNLMQESVLPASVRLRPRFRLGP